MAGLDGSRHRSGRAKRFRVFQRSVAVLLAATLTDEEIHELIDSVKEFCGKSNGDNDDTGDHFAAVKLPLFVRAFDLRSVLINMGLESSSQQISNLADGAEFDTFAFDLKCLEDLQERREFVDPKKGHSVKDLEKKHRKERRKLMKR